MTLALGNIADIARETPAVEQAILDGRPYEAVCAVDGSEAFVEAFDEFIVEFGHRAVGEFDPSRPRWRDDPSAPLGIVRGTLPARNRAHTSLGSVSANANGRHRPRSTSYKRVPSEGCSARPRAARESSAPDVSKPHSPPRRTEARRRTPVRSVARGDPAGGRASRSRGRPRRPERRVVSPERRTSRSSRTLTARSPTSPYENGSTSGTAGSISRRSSPARAKFLEWNARTDVDEHTLVGTGVSAGVVEGVARIVVDPAHTTLQSGEILVCPSSDPAWTPLFATAGGLVTEVGGRLTHGARRPRVRPSAVVSVADATEVISDGQRIRVNGDTGTVELLDEQTSDMTEASKTTESG